MFTSFVSPASDHLPAIREEDKKEALSGLAEAGFSPTDLSNDELAKTHGRHLVGGSAVFALATIPCGIGYFWIVPSPFQDICARCQS